MASWPLPQYAPVESDSDLSVVGMQNLMSITAPVVCGRRRVAAQFPDLEHRATGSAVINGAQLPGSKRKSVESNFVNDPFRNDTLCHLLILRLEITFQHRLLLL